MSWYILIGIPLLAIAIELVIIKPWKRGKEEEK